MKKILSEKEHVESQMCQIVESYAYFFTKKYILTKIATGLVKSKNQFEDKLCKSHRGP